MPEPKRKKKKDKPFNNPFAALKIEQKAGPAAVAPAQAPRPERAHSSTADDDASLFLQAVGEVAPVRTGPRRVDPPAPPSAASLKLATEEAEALAQLAELVSGEGSFDLATADDYIEGSVQGFDERVMRKLRAGEFSWRAHVDLHGLDRPSAREELETFINRARIEGHRCVLVVTGRGLHSKDQIPVLKQSVQEWFTHGRLARQVLGFCTARPVDGGAGAVYVLLRR